MRELPGTRILPLAVAAAYVGLACTRVDGPGATAHVDTLPGGALVVRNPDAGLWRDGEGWRLEEDLRIGAVEGTGPDVFGNVMSLSLAVGAEGHMFVLDGQSHEVRVFDASGTYLRRFGRSGAGPGEMRSPSFAGLSPEGNVLVVDPPNARYSTFSPTGVLLASHRRQISYSMYPWPGIADQAGRIVDLGVAPVPPYAQVLVRANLATAAADTFPLPSYDGGSFQLLNPAGRPIRSLSIPFAGRLVWRLDPRGYVWSAITDEYRIVQQRLPGDTVLIIELARAPAPVSAEERATALEGLADFEVAGGRVDRSQIPSTKPQFHDFMVDDRGYLWVATAGGLDVFGPDGRYLGVVTGSNLIMWPARPVFRGAYVYGFTLDELHVAYLVRLRVEGRG